MKEGTEREGGREGEGDKEKEIERERAQSILKIVSVLYKMAYTIPSIGIRYGDRVHFIVVQQMKID
jgi:hypothetical protein